MKKEFRYAITDSKGDIIASGVVSKKSYALQTAIDMLPTANELKVNYFTKLFKTKYHEEKYRLLSDRTLSLICHDVYLGGNVCN